MNRQNLFCGCAGIAGVAHACSVNPTVKEHTMDGATAYNKHINLTCSYMEIQERFKLDR